MPSDQGTSTLQDELGNAGDVGDLKGETSCTTAITCTVIGNQLMNNKTGGHRYFRLQNFTKTKLGLNTKILCFFSNICTQNTKNFFLVAWGGWVSKKGERMAKQNNLEVILH